MPTWEPSAQTLRHVDLGVAPGEVVLLTGASGCGKSTLALALCGLIPSRVHGELREQGDLRGRDAQRAAPHKASQLVGMVFQNPNQQLISQTVESEVAGEPENLESRSRRSPRGSTGAWMSPGWAAAAGRRG